MKKIQTNQKGIAHLGALLLILIVVAAVGFAAWRVLGSKNQTGSTPEETAAKSETKIKHLGINIEDFDKSSGMAGDIKFTKYKFPEGTYDTIFAEYGRREPNNSAEGNSDRYNPQPTFLAPLGTKVHSLVDGTVYDVPKLYSNDYSVMVIGEDGNENVIFETEHVINVTVKKGDKVKAGDVIAEVSDYNGDTLGGLGLVEIGVLVPGNPPKHVCTFDYLDDSFKDEALAKISGLMDSWEEYIGDNKVYDQESQPIAGCASRDAVEG